MTWIPLFSRIPNYGYCYAFIVFIRILSFNFFYILPSYSQVFFSIFLSFLPNLLHHFLIFFPIFVVICILCPDYIIFSWSIHTLAFFFLCTWLTLHTSPVLIPCRFACWISLLFKLMFLVPFCFLFVYKIFDYLLLNIWICTFVYNSIYKIIMNSFVVIKKWR